MARGCTSGAPLLLLLVIFPHLDASQAVDQGLSDILNELWKLDKNRLKSGTDYTISLQGRAGYVSQGSNVARDYASAPLFSYVNEAKLKKIKTFSYLMNLLDNYEPSTGVAEKVTAEEIAENNLFLNAVLETDVMKRTHRYLVSKGHSQSDLSQFRNQLYNIWFHLYHRDRRGSEDSCGFEHVFVGETKSGTELMGLHNWVQFYLLEKQGLVDYKGYKSRDRDTPNKDDHILNIQFSWNGLVKPVGSAFVGVSPEFEVAAFTILFLASTEKTTRAVVNMDKYQVELVVSRHGRYIGTAYPHLLSTRRP
ncbi:uridylate-specific endoribonuclease C-like [Brienomyrus brachyistius]|uniref:uridylate-specific endoribonuclease C-like n=1 Tax=Brienomyrus brachyistius TaxID=42636 RepID=UPI0020B44E5A|nr:uridylate-specific endoribonuclease C-like [Brienomyrus brachyistius]